MNRTLYTLLFHLGLPLVALRLYLRARKAPAYGQRIGERFAFKLPAMRQGGIWVHAVSVGESIAAAPMVRALLKAYPELPITLTCMTPTGSERIRALFANEPRVQHCYLPYDLPWAAGRFLDHVQPKLGIIMETELWPNHIHQCARRGIPVALANARLSERSARGYGRFARLTRPMLAEMSLIAVQTETEAQRFRDLGARPERVQVTGSIKFDLTIDEQLLPRARALREQLGGGQRPVWIAASTHDGEDALILQAHRQLLQVHGDALLILVPRHPERFNAVHALCSEQFTTVRRSAARWSMRKRGYCWATPWANCCSCMPWPTLPSSVAAWCRPVGTIRWSLRRWPCRCSWGRMCSTSSKSARCCARRGRCSRWMMLTGWPARCAAWWNCRRTPSAWVRRAGR